MKHVMDLPFPLSQSEVLSSNIFFKGMSMYPGLGDPLLTPSVASETPVLLSEKSPAVEMAKSQDLPSPQPIPQGRRAQMTTAFIYFCESRFCFCVLNASLHVPYMNVVEMLTGWWKVSSSEELSRIVSACHPRGIRERVLQKQIQKHMECLTQVCAKNKDGKLYTLLHFSDHEISSN